MNLAVANSGSDGNTYLLNSDTDCVVLDCGVNFKTVMKMLDFNISKIRFAVCSHVHADHMKYVKDYLNKGFKVLMPKQVKERFEDYTLAIQVEPMKRISIGGFKVTPFEVPHDEDVTCFAYIIEHKDFGKLLYMTDCMYCRYNLKKLKINHFLCECNYIKELADENYEKGLRDRVLKTHMELETVKEFIRVNASDSLQNVILCHLSTENADADKIVAEVQKIVPSANVDVARAGLVVSLRNMDECPF